MKIAIIGAGWMGCHLAHKLKNNHKITIYDKEDIFSGSSSNNQNRLHLGFHYARNQTTRNMCKITFNKFIEDYKEVVSDVNNNIYSIPEKESLLDFETYKSILDHEKYDYEICNVPELNNIEGSIKVKEKHIDHQKARSFFRNSIGNVFYIEKITEKLTKKFKQKYDIVINCTNNMLLPYKNDFFYELCIMLKYKKLKKTSFDALTLVDGNLFSIFPYQENTFTLSTVKHTPINSFKSTKELNKENINQAQVNHIINKMEKTTTKYYKNFKNDFKYEGYFISVKSKIVSESSNRFPIIKKEDNLINCFSGKIQGIYLIEEFIKGLL